MVMIEKDINEFVTIKMFKNGKYKLSQQQNNEINVYRILKENGYGKAKIDNRSVYFKREKSGDISSSDYKRICNELRQMLVHNTNFINIPENVSITDITNWFYRNDLINQKNLDSYIGDAFSENEIHQYKMKYDTIYGHNHKVLYALDFLKTEGFKKAENNACSLSGKNTDLYYKNLPIDDRYLIFSHHKISVSGTINDCFDGWFARYKNEKHIGKLKPVELNPAFWSPFFEKDKENIRNFITP